MLFEKKYVGHRVEIGTSGARYGDYLMEGKEVKMEFKGLRDAVIFTDIRMIVLDPQGLRGKKIAVISIPWKSVSAFSVETAGTFDPDAELKICGSGFGICELEFGKGTDMRPISWFLTQKVTAA